MFALPILHYPTEEDVCRALAEAPAKGWPQDEAELLEVFNRMWERMMAGGYRNDQRALVVSSADPQAVLWSKPQSPDGR
jgi:hypothetical protein